MRPDSSAETSSDIVRINELARELEVKAKTKDAAISFRDRHCRYIGSHSQPIETQGIRPTLDELKADYNTILQARQPHKE